MIIRQAGFPSAHPNLFISSKKRPKNYRFKKNNFILKNAVQPIICLHHNLSSRDPIFMLFLFYFSRGVQIPTQKESMKTLISVICMTDTCSEEFIWRWTH